MDFEQLKLIFKKFIDIFIIIHHNGNIIFNMYFNSEKLEFTYNLSSLALFFNRALFIKQINFDHHKQAVIIRDKEQFFEISYMEILDVLIRLHWTKNQGSGNRNKFRTYKLYLKLKNGSNIVLFVSKNKEGLEPISEILKKEINSRASNQENKNNAILPRCVQHIEQGLYTFQKNQKGLSLFMFLIFFILAGIATNMYLSGNNLAITIILSIPSLISLFLGLSVWHGEYKVKITKDLFTIGYKGLSKKWKEKSLTSSAIAPIRVNIDIDPYGHWQQNKIMILNKEFAKDLDDFENEEEINLQKAFKVLMAMRDNTLQIDINPFSAVDLFNFQAILQKELGK